ncbi:hypothetical protein BGZ76_002656 [Entomortierella beljakovae]|nr:hypothetical protein BGZ76_002656 [Entomortierella beljakovae]
MNSSISVPPRNPQRDPPKGISPNIYHDPKGHQPSGAYGAHHPYPSPPQSTGIMYNPMLASSPPQHYHSQQTPYTSQNIPPPQYQSHAFIVPHQPTNLPPPPSMPPPVAPGYGQKHPDHHPQQSYNNVPYPVPSSYSPAPPSVSPSNSMPSMHHLYSMQNGSQGIDTLILGASLSSLSLSPSISSNGHSELSRVASLTADHLRRGSVASKSTGAGTSIIRTTMDCKTAEVLTSLAYENMPRCYVVAPPAVQGSSSGMYTPFCIQAPCQALGLHQKQQAAIHFPKHPGYVINNPELIMKTHGTVLQHLANLACLVSGATDSVNGKKLLKHAEKFLKVVKPGGNVPAAKDTPEMNTAVESTSLQIEAFISEHLHLEGFARLMRDITGSNRSEDWSGGLKKIISPVSGRVMWVCDDCYIALQHDRYEELASLDDLIGYPDKGGVKSEANLQNAVAVEVYSQMMKGQSRIKNSVVNIIPAYFEAPERKSATTFLANQRLMLNLANSLREAHLTMIEINANQSRDSELMEKDNIYLYMRQLFDCYHFEFVKLTGLPFLLREKLPGYLNHAKYLSFDGVLVDNDKAVANMKKLITSNSDMENLSITRAHLTSTGLKVLCSAHKNLRRLTRFDLSHNRIDCEGVQEFANNVLPTSLDLRIIDFSDNPNIGTAGCNALLKAIWPSSSHMIKLKWLISLLLSNTGFSDESARFLSRSMDGENCVGKLFNLNLSGNQIAKPGLFDLMNSISRNATSSTLKKISLSQHQSAYSFPGALDQEVIHFLGVHPTITHLTLSNISLLIVAQIVNLNKSLLSLVVDDVVCTSNQDHTYALSGFNSLCQSIANNGTLQDLKLRLAWSFWTLAFQSSAKADKEANWNIASQYMTILENCVQRNTILRCFQMRGVTNFEEEIKLAASLMPHLSGAVSHTSNELQMIMTDGEIRMAELSQSVKRHLERNQVLYYGGKHGIVDQLICQFK